jgi:hypothetical protein
MRGDDVRFAAAARDDGIRKISKFTWRAGAAGVVFSAVMAVAFGHHVAAQTPATGHTGSQQPTTGSTGSGSTGSGSTGSGSTGSGGTGNGSGGGSQGGQGTIVVPAQPPAPASGSGQVTSGAS